MAKLSKKRRKQSQLAQLAAHESNLRQQIAKAYEHERMVYSIRDNQITALCHLIATATFIGDSIILDLSKTDAVLIAAGIGITIPDGSRLGMK